MYVAYCLSDIANIGAIKNHLLEGPRVHVVCGRKSQGVSISRWGKQFIFLVGGWSFLVFERGPFRRLGAGGATVVWVDRVVGWDGSSCFLQQPARQASRHENPLLFYDLLLRLQCCLHGLKVLKSPPSLLFCPSFFLSLKLFHELCLTPRWHTPIALSSINLYLANLSIHQLPLSSSFKAPSSLPSPSSSFITELNHPHLLLITKSLFTL